MKNTSLETKLGMFVALVVVAALVLLEIAGGTDFFKKGYRLHGLFSTAQELKLGDPVKMAGVPIGKVEKIDFEAGKVRVTFKVNQGVEIKTDAKATIRFAGLMGQNFVSINLGTATAPDLKDGDLIGTVEQADLALILQKLDHAAAGIENLAKSFSGQSVESILGPLNSLLTESKPRIMSVLTNADSISTRLAKGQLTIGELALGTNDLQKVMATVDSFKGTADDARSLIGTAKVTLNTVNGAFADAKGFITNAQNSLADVKLAVGDARRALTNASETVTVARQTLTGVRDDIQAGKGSLGKLLKDEALYRETTLSMTNLREILQKVNQGQGSVGKFVNDDSLFKNAKMTLQKLDMATESLEDQGPLSVLGMAVGKLF